ncbi:MAG: bifunctional 3,4-dihydroxy-2-butanone-4-phosphate synthase/GTP cyclohydrolase II [Planctomycetota bacterium]|nr:bifunctional 3,4-dihydroxy-2-butanone-4-phosphate synthase/GTP cyclohydrolase II [Planctomycetota bacterium]
MVQTKEKDVSVFAPVEELLSEMKAGRMVVLVDDENRENEGDLVLAAEHITPEIVNFIVTHARGVLCVAMTGEDCDRLKLLPQAEKNTAPLSTAFTVTVDAAEGITTGVSAADRAKTILKLSDPHAKPEELARPGHINPLRAMDGGVLVRTGQTEGSVDLCKLAGLRPAAVICEIMNEDGSMARVPDLVKFCEKHNMKMGCIADMIKYRQQKEIHVRRAAKVKFPSKFGDFMIHVFMSDYDDRPHLAICAGGIGDTDETGTVPVSHDPVLVRVHSECLTGDVLGSLRCDCGPQLHTALEQIAKAGKGVLLYMRQEGRGIGLKNKLKAYALQDSHGVDTVEANEMLGFGADERDYGVGAQILYALGIRKINLLTNNPRKVIGLEGFGLTIEERVAIEIPANENNAKYLATKRDKLGHLLKGI